MLFQNREKLSALIVQKDRRKTFELFTSHTNLDIFLVLQTLSTTICHPSIWTKNVMLTKNPIATF